MFGLQKLKFLNNSIEFAALFYRAWWCLFYALLFSRFRFDFATGFCAKIFLLICVAIRRNLPDFSSQSAGKNS
jgi:hypothetical protein